MKSLMLLLQSVLEDSGTWCRTSTTRDFKEITRRVEHEGLSFLTITLPTYGSDFERCLDMGKLVPGTFLSFRKRAALPLLLRGLLELVFDSSSGLLLDKPSTDAIYFIRQITLMWKKILLPCSESREKRAYDSYVKCEQEVQEWSDRCTTESIDSFGRVSDLCWGALLSRVDLLVYSGNLTPKHGPGATADRLFGNEKYNLRAWTHRIEEFFPSSDFAIPNSGFHEHLGEMDFFEPDAEQPVRVISVPKTLKTPRIIAIEPSYVQYVQQALLSELVVAIERDDILQGCIGFTHQDPNRALARLGSETGGLATIDLSEASDRVSNLLVKRLFRNYPSLAGAIQASRSQRADVPGHGIISLSKFASMGSATTFPVEAMVFLTIVLCAYEKWLSRSLTKGDLYRFLSRVRIYGDDIIVPTDIVSHVVSELEAYGLKVNTKKSFWTGKFRESCGGDYYDGNDVTVTYCRRVLPERRGNVSEMISCVSMRNQFYKNGLWKTAEFLDSYLRRLAPLPTVLDTSPVVGRHSFLGYETERDCDKLHKPLVKGMVVVPKLRSSKLDGYGALLKFFLRAEKGKDSKVSWLFPSNSDAKHLERYGRPESVDIKIRWASAT